MKYKASLTFAIFFYFSLVTQSQSLRQELTNSLTAIKLEPLGLSLHQERFIFNNSTGISYGVGGYYSFYNNTFPPLIGYRFIAERSNLFGKDYSTSALTPYILVGIRKFITLPRRIRLNKNIQNNSGSYFGLLLEYPLNARVIDKQIDNLEIATPLSLLFGLRRSFSYRFFLEAEGGLSYKKARSLAEITPRLNVSINLRL